MILSNNLFAILGKSAIASLNNAKKSLHIIEGFDNVSYCCFDHGDRDLSQSLCMGLFL
jgi:hypothetical protein